MTAAVYCGIDWASDHHDVALVSDDGRLLVSMRITDDAAGYAALLGLLAEHGDCAEDPIPVAIETTKGLLVACLRRTGRPVFAINPLAASRYRDRHAVSRRKSDAADAAMLAHILRTDRDMHRPLPADTDLAQAVAVLARAQQDAVWAQQQVLNQLQAALAEYFPAALRAFRHLNGGLTRPEARAVLAATPTPAQAATLTLDQARNLLRAAGRQRGIERDATHVVAVFAEDVMRQPPAVERAMGRRMLALLRQLDAVIASAEDLAEATTEHFTRHPNAAIILSFPGLGPLLGARILAEIGDDPTRFSDPRALKAYAGSAPVTRASGRSRTVSHRRVKNQRLAAVGYLWIFSSLRASDGYRAHYDRRRAGGETFAAAQRNLFNKALGQLHHCLATRQPYDESQAFPTPATAA